jgi:hypothetical protein
MKNVDKKWGVCKWQHDEGYTLEANAEMTHDHQN